MKHVELSRNEWHFVAERFAAAVRQLLLKSVLLLGDTVCIRWVTRYVFVRNSISDLAMQLTLIY